jgi:N-methylhydantoinase A
LREGGGGRLPEEAAATEIGPSKRRIYFSETGWTEAPIVRFETMTPGERLKGPAVVESSFTTVVVDPGATASRTEGGGLQVTF